MTSGKLTASLLAPFLFLTSLLANQNPTTSTASAIDVVREAVRQMGGEDKLRALRGMHFKAASYRNALEQSERPEGPYIVEYDEISESRDLEHSRWKQEVEMNFQMQPAVKIKEVVADGAASREFSAQTIPASRDQLQQAEEALELCPERILLTAAAAPDLRLEPDTSAPIGSYSCRRLYLERLSRAYVPQRVYFAANSRRVEASLPQRYVLGYLG